MASGCYDFVFTSDRKPSFEPGQYLELDPSMFRHPDDRGKTARPFNYRLGRPFRA